MRFGIRPQAVLLAIVPLVALSMLLALATFVANLTQQGAAISAHLADVISQSTELIEIISSTNGSVQDYAKARRPADLASIRQFDAKMRGKTQRLLKSVQSEPQLKPFAAAYVRVASNGMTVMGSYADLLRRGKLSEARRIAESPATRKLGIDLEQSQLAFNQAAQSQVLMLLTGRRETLRLLEQLLLICAGAGIALTVLTSFLFGIRIIGRLKNLGDNARRLADGAPTVPDLKNDEIGELDRIYHEMAERIQNASRENEETLNALKRERDTANVLQQALMPIIAPIAGLRIDTAYATPANSAEIGGDWFDVFSLSDQLVGLSVGDVTGHGVRAAAMMGFVRQAIRIAAHIELQPCLVLERVNQVVCEDEHKIIVTAFYGTYNRDTNALIYAIAGHGPPIVAGPDGAIATVDGGGLLLGVDRKAKYDTFEHQLESDDALVLYTDGIVEAERDYPQGMQALASAIRDELRDASANVAEGIQRRVFRDSAPRDDSALLVLRIGTPAVSKKYAGKSWDFDVRDQRAAWCVKRELMRELFALGPLAPEPSTAELVFGELLGNVVRHAPGPARVSLTVHRDDVTLTMEDQGRAFAKRDLRDIRLPPDDAENGRGLYLVAALCSSVEFETTADGKRTTVVLPAAVPGPGPAAVNTLDEPSVATNEA